ncbi:hypothetical protein [Nocardia sp. NPDC059195]|uniref:hypothetical protein n=1 Tax=Nocardia sp. NPDC059195 TaxID=3346765 RepID=UPI003691B8F9
MTADQTEHAARSVGNGGWVVSYLPGRTLTIEQATAAMQAAEAISTISGLAQQVGLTALEAMGLAIADSPWEQPQPPGPRRFPWRR